MELIRIGDKVVSKDKIYAVVDKILSLRAGGLSQQDVADELSIDRTLVSRLESIGEVRKGGKLAVAGFPVKNKEEIQAVCQAEGVDFVFLMTEAERWEWVRSKGGADLLNEVMGLISRAKECDPVIFLGSDMRIRLVQAIVGSNVVGIEIGASPINEDKYVDPEAIRRMIASVRS